MNGGAALDLAAPICLPSGWAFIPSLTPGWPRGVRLVRNGPRIWLILISALALSGCLTFGAVERRSTAINEGVGATGNRAVLLNLVRASRAEPLYFMSLTTLHATATGDLKLGLPQGTLGPVDFPVRVAQNYTFGANASNTLDNNTTTSFDMGVLASKDFYAGLLAPLGVADVDLLLHQGFSRELVFYLVIDHAKVTPLSDDDPLKKGGPFVLYNDPTAANFKGPAGFQEYMRQAMITGLTTQTVPAPQDVAEGKKSGPSVELCYEPALATSEGRSEIADSKSICGAETPKETAKGDTSSALMVKLVSPLDGKKHNYEIEVTTRSIFGIFNYLGALIAGGDEDDLRLHDYQLPAEKPDTDPILDVLARGEAGSGCFTAVSYGGERYCVPQKGAENTKRVFAILNMLIALKQAPGDLPITQTVRIEQ
jgi:hypothetical protein